MKYGYTGQEKTTAHVYGDARIDPALFVATGHAEPTSRVLDGYAEEWAEPGVLATGEKVFRMYLFGADEIGSDAENYPWDDAHVARIKLHD